MPDQTPHHTPPGVPAALCDPEGAALLTDDVLVEAAIAQVSMDYEPRHRRVGFARACCKVALHFRSLANAAVADRSPVDLHLWVLLDDSHHKTEIVGAYRTRKEAYDAAAADVERPWAYSVHRCLIVDDTKADVPARLPADRCPGCGATNPILACEHCGHHWDADTPLVDSFDRAFTEWRRATSYLASVVQARAKAAGEGSTRPVDAAAIDAELRALIGPAIAAPPVVEK